MSASIRMPTAPLARISVMPCEHVLERGLRVEVDREAKRLVDEAGIAEPFVEDALDAGDADDLGRVDALAPVARAAEDVRGHGAVRIEPRLAGPEEQARLAEVVHPLALLGRDRALDPHELSPVGELGVEAPGVEVGEIRASWSAAAAGSIMSFGWA